MYLKRAKQFFVFSLVTFFSLSYSSCDKSSDDGEDIIEKNKVNKEAGEKFLAENMSKDSVEVTFSGLQYKFIKKGSGVRPSISDSVDVEMEERMIDGTTFYASSETSVLASNLEGVQEGLKHAPEGSELVLYVPYYLAYGASAKSFIANGKTLTLGAYSAIIINCKLNRVVVKEK